ncbi:uncharacterized protein CIMG_09704 [Coccidioides immitis RS]|uniref:Queuosine 5'-phosphate N-glycosylase/hydrolase n=4 Tax=Coccidioides immitis TaxID=5501 RepID=J3K2Y5_COCIM|nr:uncharacterized protein CIMG_09704 [Coccidioides immitis RS]KMP02710.1 hypothetical protein CIRG_02402 [Coccidioides immitis RMSCC 2394]KMU80922.1 hypothetical protein CISG_08818 [Coccidioides immitis RMSCC 3703]KMU89652.1 hypothetical protein CIHG_07459 [Coccidioides immitis H538.4]TPX23195.1 hypothetical protein DIZ76_012521 [Coccidioides immitis]EAS28500.3 hypothetical protein CIMG_09704 [Coccidioides immitis RS]
MSDDEADPELLELLRQSLGLGGPPKNAPAETKVLQGAQYVFDNAIDVALSPAKTKEAAETIWQMMQERSYSTKTWASHELHPKEKNEKTVDFIFTMDLLNFSFWSAEKDESKRFAIDYRGKRWTGYWSLVAALQRALDEEIPITSPEFWQNAEECTEDVIKHVFRSATDEEIPLLQERIASLREAGRILCDEYDCSFVNCIEEANNSAAALVNLLAENFPCFRDEATFERKTVRFYKRAQILVADIWACFRGRKYGKFNDIDKITMFADYRVPQMLHQLGCLLYSPRLESHIRQLKLIPSGDKWEIELRGASIWCVELIRQMIMRNHAAAKAGAYAEGSSLSTSGSQSVEALDMNLAEEEKKRNNLEPRDLGGDDEEEGGEEKPMGVNAILIDFLLYDRMKEVENDGKEEIPHHRTRSIWY